MAAVDAAGRYLSAAELVYGGTRLSEDMSLHSELCAGDYPLRLLTFSLASNGKLDDSATTVIL